MKRLAAVVAVALGCAALGCPKANPQSTRADGTSSESVVPREAGTLVVSEWIYDGGLKNSWEDWGWTKRDLGDGGTPAHVFFANYGGWMLAHPGLRGTYGGLTFRYRAPDLLGDFLEVHVESPQKGNPPLVRVNAHHKVQLEGGWVEVFIPIEELAPDEVSFDRIIIRAPISVASFPVDIDKIGLTQGVDAGAKPLPPSKPAILAVDCKGRSFAINPLIYGIAYDFQHDAKDTHQFNLGATARRWGGNPTSRYNWEHGHAWNTANDWYFENVDYSSDPAFTYKTFLQADMDKGLQTAMTVPTLGWVAKDTSSNGFPTDKVPGQQASDPSGKPAGNGKTADGKPTKTLPPSQTSIPAPPEFIGRWVDAIKKFDAQTGKRSVQIYILDNEPALWNSTHRDVHPEPVGYDELLDRTVRYGAAIRKADPGALIAGPAEWGWPGYAFSAKDSAAGFTLKPDRRLHGDKPLMAWYLEKLKDYEAKNGTRILDLVDLHFYPQGKDVYGPASDKATAELRIRSTRALWDPSYVDESWIGEAVRLLPRMHDWINENYPGRGIQIGEWSFGGEAHISGALAIAETLGRFAQNDVASAFYWTYPPDASPAYWAFRMYRNYDGKGGHFLDRSFPTNATTQTSLFASRDPSGKKMVLVALNLAKDAGADATIDVGSCGQVTSRKSYTYTGAAAGPVPNPATTNDGARVAQALPPWSITVLELDLEPAK